MNVPALHIVLPSLDTVEHTQMIMDVLRLIEDPLWIRVITNAVAYGLGETLIDDDGGSWLQVRFHFYYYKWDRKWHYL